MMSQLASSIASFALVSIAYAALIGALRRAAPRYRQLAVGAILGAGAVLCTLAQHHGGKPLPLGGGIATIGLAQPFGGGLATLVASGIAAASYFWLDGVPLYPGLAEIPLAACIAVAVTEALRRVRPGFGLRELAALALALTLGAGLLLAPSGAFRQAPADTALALGGQVLLGTVILGIMLQRWGEAEWRIGESERRRRALVANVPGTVMQIIANAAGELRFVFDTDDPARIFDGALGWSTPDPAKVLQAIHPDDRALFRRSLIEAGRSLSPWLHEFRMLPPGGKQRWLRARATATLTPGGDILWEAIVVNITTRKDVEQVLRRSEALHRLLAENTTEFLGSIGPQQSWLYVSPSAREIVGHDPDELVGRPWLSLVDAADVARVTEALAGLVPGGPAVTVAYRVRRADGSLRWVEETRRIAGKTVDGGPGESISVIRPVAAPRAEPLEAVAAKEPGRAPDRHFARMLEAASAGIVVLDPHHPDHPVIFVNRAAMAITGYSRAELIGRSWRWLQGGDADPKIASDVEEAMRQQQPLSTSFVGQHKNGTTYWAKLDFSPVRDEAGKVDAYVSIFADISEQKRIEEDLRRARDAAEEANQAKSHELRTPLNGVIGFTNLLLNENLPAEQRRYATFAHDAGSSLLAIINNILDLSKIEAGKLTLVETDFSVVELAVSCNTVVWHAARERGLDLNFVLKPDVTSLVRGDPNRIRQVLLNLLSNAIKYTEKGSVVLTIAKVEDQAQDTVLKFSVTDTGIGIAKEQQSKLFQKFSQIEDQPGIYLRGTGLGLAICKSLVEQMGGTIGVTSMPAVGSNFWFTVPLKTAVGLKPGAVPAGARGARILLVEDTVMNQELMITLLRRAGHEVDVAGDGEAALEAMQQRRFDLVLMDVQLPRMDGLEATRQIRRLAPPASQVPVIAMTARALAGDVEECVAAGMNDHLAKPVDAAALLAMIERWVPAHPPELPGAAPQEADRFPVRDEEALRDLEAHIGSGKLHDLLARAQEELPRRLRRINDCRSDHPLLEREAHELISVAGSAGLLELAESARGVMQACREESAVRISSTLVALNVAAERALAALDADHRA
jgi:PAS domain S-box-containing protein